MIRDIDCCVANFSNCLVILLTSCGSVSVSSLNWPSAVCLPELSLFTYKQSYHKMPYQDDKWSLGSLALIERSLTRVSMSAAGDTGDTGASLEGEASGRRMGLFLSPASSIMQASIQSVHSTCGWSHRHTCRVLISSTPTQHLPSGSLFWS